MPKFKATFYGPNGDQTVDFEISRKELDGLTSDQQNDLINLRGLQALDEDGRIEYSVDGADEEAATFID